MDLLSFIDKNFASIIALVGTIGGTVIGGYFSNKTQQRNISKQIEWEKIKIHQSQMNETFGIYNRVLETNGTKTVIENYGGHGPRINLTDYNEHIRSLLFEKFHQLHQDVAEKVIEIDELIEMCNFFEELTDEDSEKLANMYLELLSMIKSQMRIYRKSVLGL